MTGSRSPDERGMTALCPNCRQIIPAGDVNEFHDTAFCRRCNITRPLSKLDAALAIDPLIDPTEGPAGTWYRTDSTGTRVGASCRSFGSAAGLLAMSLFWNGILSFFAMLLLANVARLIGLDLPDWMPEAALKESGKLSWPTAIFMGVFLTPFAAIGLAMLLATAMAMAGHMEVTVDDTACEIYTGIGSLGRRKRFARSAIRSVRIDLERCRNRRTVYFVRKIAFDLVGEKPYLFGSQLPDARRDYLASALHGLLIHPEAASRPNVAFQETPLAVG